MMKGMDEMKNINDDNSVEVYLKGKVLDYDSNQTYNVRVQLEDGSPVWVKGDMLLTDKDGTGQLEKDTRWSSEPRKLIFFHGMKKYMRYDKLMKIFELVDHLNLNSDIYQYWFSKDEVGNIIWMDHGVSLPVQMKDDE